MDRLHRIMTWSILLTVMPSTALPWGSVAPAQTHQHILHEAYRLLRADPAYNPDRFPTLAEVAVHEGVEWTAIGLVGNSPDAAGKTRYSEHYYNPTTGRGDGPASAAKYYGYLARATLQIQKQKEATAKSAAWGAHFLADMCVPYHVVGMPRAEAIRTLNTQLRKHPDAVFLGLNILGTGKLVFKTVSPLQAGQMNFLQSYTRFRDQTDPVEVDWYDPWYYNGITDLGMVKTSSHIAWEATPKHEQTTVNNTAPSFKNAGPTFKDPWIAQSLQVQNLAKDSAKATRAQLEHLFDKPEAGIDRAIQAVYTAWRASFSGMRPSLSYTQNPNGSFRVVARVRNAARGGVAGINARLTVSGGTSKEATLAGKATAIGSSLEKEIKAWDVQAARAGSAVALKLEVIGTYKEPDLQYAVVEHIIELDEPDAYTLVKLSPDIKDGAPNTPVEFKATVTGLSRHIKEVGYKFYVDDGSTIRCCNYQYNDSVLSGVVSPSNRGVIIPFERKFPKGGKYRVAVEIWDGPPPTTKLAGSTTPPKLLANSGVDVEMNPLRECPCQGFDPSKPREFPAACGGGRCIEVQGRIVQLSNGGCNITLEPHPYHQKEQGLPASLNLTACGRAYAPTWTKNFQGSINVTAGVMPIP